MAAEAFHSIYTEGTSIYAGNQKGPKRNILGLEEEVSFLFLVITFFGPVCFILLKESKKQRNQPNTHLHQLSRSLT